MIVHIQRCRHLKSSKTHFRSELPNMDYQVLLIVLLFVYEAKADLDIRCTAAYCTVSRYTLTILIATQNLVSDQQSLRNEVINYNKLMTNCNSSLSHLENLKLSLIHFIKDYVTNTGCSALSTACQALNATDHGTFMLYPDVCNCCDYCLTNLGEGEECVSGSPGQLRANEICGPGLTCTINEGSQATCQKSIVGFSIPYFCYTIRMSTV